MSSTALDQMVKLICARKAAVQGKADAYSSYGARNIGIKFA